MTSINSTANASEPHYDNLTRKVGLVIVIPAILFSELLSDVLGPGRSWAAGFGIIILLSVIAIYWHLKKEVWFWISMVALAVLHIAAMLWFEWNKLSSYAAPLLLGPALADIWLSSLCIRAVGRSFRRSGASKP
jgi:hypothetical protein